MRKSSICSMVYVTLLLHPKNALRRASGIWSLGGAGLFPE
jgi:hypothetical protein